MSPHLCAGAIVNLASKKMFKSRLGFVVLPVSSEAMNQQRKHTTQHQSKQT
jgi:hypothetical protein